MAAGSELPAASKRDWITCGLAFAATALLLAPVVRPDLFPKAFDETTSAWLPGIAIAGLIPIAAFCLAAWRWLPYPRDQRWGTLLAMSLLSVWCVDLHYSNVDLMNYFGDLYVDNVEWQRRWHDRILRLDPGVIPHCYRFLPDCLVACIQLLTGKYFIAAMIYRLTAQFLLLLCVYRFARRWLEHLPAAAVLLLFAIAYPPSLRYYAGQLTDPLSHISFLLCFLALDANRPGLFCAPAVIGVLAKESILIVPLYAALSRLRRPKEALVWLTIFAASLALAIVVRVVVARNVTYEKISGVTPAHIRANFLDAWHWGRQAWETVGALAFVAALRWRSQPRQLWGMFLFLFACLWVSNLVFSHLKEARNFIPLTPIVAVMAVNTFLRRDLSQPEMRGSTSPAAG
jgi:hypothetical protein